MINKFHLLPTNVKKSIAEQMKLLSWVLGGINGFFMHTFGDTGGIFFIILWWVIFQFFAHYILFNIPENYNKEL